MAVQSKDGSGTGQNDNPGPKTGLGIEMHQAHALLIGVGECRYEPWSLPVTTRDVAKLSSVLADPALCAYPPGNIRLLTSEAATRAGILAELEALAARAAEEKDATFLVYYSGHGWEDTSGGTQRYFLIPHDVDEKNIAESALPAEDFIAALREIDSQRLLVMIDTCHAARFGEAKEAIPKGFAVQPIPSKMLGAGEGRAVFLSCLENQKSWILDGPNSLSVFTQQLIAGLGEAGWAKADSGTRTVTVSDLMGYLGATVPEEARKLGQLQTPYFKFETQEFAVALDRGGKGSPVKAVPATQSKTSAAAPQAPITVGSSHSVRDTIFAGSIGTLTTGSSGK